ncbi:ABC transporter permease [Staphylococcus sp. 18_1_E_LY]|uniref:ABC transporter permease n=1 Tax=Staphylococcus lloydii TaxID=2781774 RepID=A0A7T1B0L2_9STAP|nr:ABC transporter permease [Staphylococcus lloydii]MBF7020209.1 ABC transporter permease [Staphylococcus lloydii]MBF7027892.1 ABC transporter permease [Staphylococcus lloydii]QPM75562.1 ABC transporter permease [Staphylococcus lloydii]
MTFNQIVLKNFKKNIQHYGMYIFSLIVSIVLFFSFVTLKYTHSINNADSTVVIKKGAATGAYFLFIIIIIFLMYASHLFIKRRTKEFAMYQLIGLTKKNIMRMLMIEQMAMFVITGIIGLIVGIFGSKILLMIVLKVLNVHTSVSINFHFQALFQTILMLVLAFVLIMCQNYIFIKKRSILQMMSDQSKSDVKNPKVTFIETISGVLGIVMILIGYYLSTEMFNKFLGAAMILPFIILALTVVGAYLFFRSSVSLIFKTAKRMKKGHVSITDVVFTSSIMHRMKKNALSLTIIATISAVTVTILCFGALSKVQLGNQIASSSPQDFTFEKPKQADKFAEQLKQHNINYKLKYKEVATPKLLKDNVLNAPQMYSNVETMIVTSNKYFHDKDVKGNTAKLINMGITGPDIHPELNKDIVVQGSKKHAFKVTSTSKTTEFSTQTSFNSPVLLVSEDKYNDLKQHSEDVRTQSGFDIVNHKQMTQAEKIAHKINPNLPSQREVKKQADQSTGILLFVTSFLGLAFLVAAGCIIYIKQMDETEDEIGNFRILRKMGYTHQDMTLGLALKVAFNFGMPLVVSLLHSLFAALAFMKLMGSSTLTPVYIVMIAYSIIYCIFAIMAFIHSHRIVKHSI